MVGREGEREGEKEEKEIVKCTNLSLLNICQAIYQVNMQYCLDCVFAVSTKNDSLSLSEDKVEQKTDNGKYYTQHNKDVVDNVDGHVECIYDDH